jgi:hypothetical protein
MAKLTAITRDERRRLRAEQRRWQAEMKRLGVEIVRTRFTARMPVTDNMPYPDTDFVQRWLAKQNRKANLQTDVLTAVAVVGAIAACIAAWPVIKEWLQ